MKAFLSDWQFKVRTCEKGKMKKIGTLAASITFINKVDEILIFIAPKRQPRQTKPMPPPKIKYDKHLLVVKFAESARLEHKSGAYSEIVSKFSEWDIMAVASEDAMA